MPLKEKPTQGKRKKKRNQKDTKGTTARILLEGKKVEENIHKRAGSDEGRVGLGTLIQMGGGGLGFGRSGSPT